MSDARQAWFAHIMASGLETQIMTPKDVLAHATPDVLARNLPPELMGQVLQASLSAGSMTPERVLETVTPEVMARHLPHDVLWQCISDAAVRAGITKAKV